MSDLKVFYKDDTPSNTYKAKTLCYLRRKNAQGDYEFLEAEFTFERAKGLIELKPKMFWKKL